MPYLTPNSNPTDTVCRVLVIPNSSEWLAIVAGALEQLTFVSNFEAYGSVAPEECVTRFVTMFDGFCYNEGQCRMIGEIIWWSGDTSPDDRWMICNGTSLLRADYPDLFAIIGTSYGAVDATHFNIPDLQSRVPIGAGHGTGLSAYNIGDTGGEETHTLTTGEMPTHSHTDAGHSHSESAAIASLSDAGTGIPIPSATASVSITGTGYASIGSSGAGGAHNNRQPYLALLPLIVVKQ